MTWTLSSKVVYEQIIHVKPLLPLSISTLLPQYRLAGRLVYCTPGVCIVYTYVYNWEYDQTKYLMIVPEIHVSKL